MTEHGNRPPINPTPEAAVDFTAPGMYEAMDATGKATIDRAAAVFMHRGSDAATARSQALEMYSHLSGLEETGAGNAAPAGPAQPPTPRPVIPAQVSPVIPRQGAPSSEPPAAAKKAQPRSSSRTVIPHQRTAVEPPQGVESTAAPESKQAEDAPDYFAPEFRTDHKLIMELEDGTRIETRGHEVWQHDPKTGDQTRLGVLETDERTPAIEKGKSWTISGVTDSGEFISYETSPVTGFKVLEIAKPKPARPVKAAKLDILPPGRFEADKKDNDSHLKDSWKKAKEMLKRNKKRAAAAIGAGVLVVAAGIGAVEYTSHHHDGTHPSEVKPTNTNDAKPTAKPETKAPGSDSRPNIDQKKIGKPKQTTNKDGDTVFTMPLSR